MYIIILMNFFFQRTSKYNTTMTTYSFYLVYKIRSVYDRMTQTISDQEIGIFLVGVVTRSWFQFCKLLYSIIFWSTLQWITKILKYSYTKLQVRLKFLFHFFLLFFSPSEPKLNCLNILHYINVFPPWFFHLWVFFLLSIVIMIITLNQTLNHKMTMSKQNTCTIQSISVKQ